MEVCSGEERNTSHRRHRVEEMKVQEFDGKESSNKIKKIKKRVCKHLAFSLTFLTAEPGG